MFKVEGVSTFLQNTQPQSEMVAECIAEESLVSFVGSPGTSKSWLAMDLGQAVASGEPWLGKYEIKGQREVVFVGEDSSRQDYRRQFTRLATPKGLSGFNEKYDSFKFMVKKGLNFPEHKEEFLDACVRYAMQDLVPGLVIIDSLRTVHRLEENDAGDMRNVMDCLKLIRDNLKCCVVYLHHEPHAQGGVRAGRGAGSREIEAASDCIFNLSAVSKRRRFSKWAMERRFKCEITRTRGLQPPDMEYLLKVERYAAEIILQVSKEDVEEEILGLAEKGVSREEMRQIFGRFDPNMAKSTLANRVTRIIKELGLSESSNGVYKVLERGSHQ